MYLNLFTENSTKCIEIIYKNPMLNIYAVAADVGIEDVAVYFRIIFFSYPSSRHIKCCLPCSKNSNESKRHSKI